MKRALLLIGAALLFTACDDPVAPPANQTLNAGSALSLNVNLPNPGSWTVASVPSWLQVSPTSGSGAVRFTVTVNRAAAAPITADTATLSGNVVLDWQNSGAAVPAGSTVLTVKADMFRATGRVADATATAGSQDARVQVRSVNTGGASLPGRVIVKYRSGAFAAQAIRAGGASASGGGQFAVLNVSDVNARLSALRADTNVEYAVPDQTLHALAAGVPSQEVQASALQAPLVPTDQYAPLQWAYRTLGYGAVWRDMDNQPYTRPVTVAVVDSGVRYDHPDLAGKLIRPGEGAFDFTEYMVDDKGSVTYDNGDGDGPDTDPTDVGTTTRTSGSHGTHVTGIIVAAWGSFTAPCTGCSATGVVGATYTAPVKVLPIRVLDSSGNGSEADVALGIQYAAGVPVTVGGTVYTNPNPAQVINLSLGGAISATNAQPLCDAVAAATARGALVVAAAGNDGNSNPFYPAACDGAVSVGSVSLSGGSVPRHVGYSNTYAQVQLSAPGGTDTYLDSTAYNGATLNGQPFPDTIFSTSWNYQTNQPNYEAESGTSQASPQVSALAALLLSKGVTTGRDDTLARMVSTATDLGVAGRDTSFGYGVINPALALGAPQVSSVLGLRLTRADGLTFTPTLAADGAFSAYLPEGSYQALAGRDTSASGVPAVVGARAGFTLDSAQTSAQVGVLSVK